MKIPGIRTIAAFVALSVALGACGGGSDGGGGDLAIDLTQGSTIDSSGTDGSADGGSDSGLDSGAPAVPTGPIDGLLLTTQSFGSGLFVIDEATGTSVELTIEGAENIDRNAQPILAGDVAWALGGTTRPDQFFSSDIKLVRVDLATGTAVAVADLGFDRETDDSTDATFLELVAATADRVIVEAGQFGGEGTWTVYDAAGVELASYPEPTFEQVYDGGSCSGDVNNVLGLPDGSFVATVPGLPARFDPLTGVADPFIGCEQQFPTLADLVTPDLYDDYILLRDGDVVDEASIDFYIDRDLDRIQGWTHGDGDLWWVVADSASSGGSRAIAGAAVQFDVATGMVEAVHPLGEHVGAFTNCPLGQDSCELHTLFGDLHFAAGRLAIIDPADSWPIVVVDPTTGSTIAIPIEHGDDVDYTRTELLPGDPDGVWAEVTRFTVTSDTDEGRSATGESFIERFDPVSGVVVQSIPESELSF